MSYMKFKEFVALREAAPMPMTATNAQAAMNPANKARVQQDLMNALKAPAPAGTNPQQYQSRIRTAIGINKTTPAATAGDAMDTAAASMKAAQP